MLCRLIGLLAAMLALSAGNADAYTLKSDEGRFTIEMPDKPVFEKRHHSSVFFQSFDTYEWLFQQPGTDPDIAWGVSYRDHKPGNKSELPDKVFNTAIKELADLVDGKLRSHQIIQHDGLRGMDLRVELSKHKFVLRAHIFVVGLRQYMIQYVGPPGSDESANVEAYLNSFRVHR